MLSLSAGGAYATPIQFNTTMDAYAAGVRAAGEAYGMNHDDIHSGMHGHAEKVGSLVSPFVWGVRIENSDSLTVNDSGGFNIPDGLLYRLYKVFGAGPMSSDGSDPGGSTFQTLLGVDINTADTRGSSTDLGAIADFLDAIGFTTTDWQPGSDHTLPADHQTPVPPGPSITRRNTRECLQSHHEQKRGVQENLCAEGGGFAGSGVGGAARRGSGGGGAALGAGGGGGNNGGNRNVFSDTNGIGSVPGNNGGGSPGNGGGQPSNPNCAAYPCNSEGGGPGNNEGGGGAPGNPPDIGGDDGGGSGSSISAEVRTVPEPAPVALLVLGFAGMYVVRSRNSLRPGGI